MYSVYGLTCKRKPEDFVQVPNYEATRYVSFLHYPVTVF